MVCLRQMCLFLDPFFPNNSALVSRWEAFTGPRVLPGGAPLQSVGLPPSIAATLRPQDRRGVPQQKAAQKNGFQGKIIIHYRSVSITSCIT